MPADVTDTVCPSCGERVDAEGVAFAADWPPSAGDRWIFACECAAADCREWVELELAEYGQIRADPDGAVVAAGHVASSRSQRARRDAERARDSVRALLAQAEQQRKRAQRLRDEARNVVTLFRPGSRGEVSSDEDALCARRGEG